MTSVTDMASKANIPAVSAELAKAFLLRELSRLGGLVELGGIRSELERGPVDVPEGLPPEKRHWRDWGLVYVSLDAGLYLGNDGKTVVVLDPLHLCCQLYLQFLQLLECLRTNLPFRHPEMPSNPRFSKFTRESDPLYGLLLRWVRKLEA